MASPCSLNHGYPIGMELWPSLDCKEQIARIYIRPLFGVAFIPLGIHLMEEYKQYSTKLTLHRAQRAESKWHNLDLDGRTRPTNESYWHPPLSRRPARVEHRWRSPWATVGELSWSEPWCKENKSMKMDGWPKGRSTVFESESFSKIESFTFWQLAKKEWCRPLRVGIWILMDHDEKQNGVR